MKTEQIVVNADSPIRNARTPGRATAVAVISVSVMVLTGMLLLWASTDRIERRLFVVGVFVLLLLTGAVGVYWLFVRARQSDVVRLANQHPLTYRQIANQPYELAAKSLEQHYGVLHATASREHPLLTSLHQTYQPQHTETHAVPALPTPDANADETIQAVPVDEWLDWIDRVPHVILAAQTGDKSTGQGGKSTTAMAILSPRIARGEHVFVIDPHASGWFGLPAVGGGHNWIEVQLAIEAITDEYLDRMRQRHDHLRQTNSELPHDHFPRLTVLVDEANEVRKALDVTVGRGKLTPWQAFTEVLGSGARKVGISVFMLAQSTNVDDFGLSGPMRNNFTRVGLDSHVIKLLIGQEEKDKDRRERLYTALNGRAFPAATVRGAQVYLLDRTGLDQRPKPASATASIWPGWAVYQAALTTKQQQLLPSPPTVNAAPSTNAERIIEMLEKQPDQKLSAIAATLGIDKQIVQNELTKLMTAKRVDRKSAKGGSLYFVQP